MKKQQILHVRSDTFFLNGDLNKVFRQESVLEKHLKDGWTITFVVPVLSNGSTLGYTYILEKEEE